MRLVPFLCSCSRRYFGEEQKDATIARKAAVWWLATLGATDTRNTGRATKSGSVEAAKAPCLGLLPPPVRGSVDTAVAKETSYRSYDHHRPIDLLPELSYSTVSFFGTAKINTEAPPSRLPVGFFVLQCSTPHRSILAPLKTESHKSVIRFNRTMGSVQGSQSWLATLRLKRLAALCVVHKAIAREM